MRLFNELISYSRTALKAAVPQSVFVSKGCTDKSLGAKQDSAVGTTMDHSRHKSCLIPELYNRQGSHITWRKFPGAFRGQKAPKGVVWLSGPQPFGIGKEI